VDFKMPKYTYEFPRPALSVDIVALSIQRSQPHILLILRGRQPFLGKWALPGGFVQIDESLTSAAARELEEETGLKNVILEQLYTFGEPNRDPRGRVISVSYYTILKEGDNHQIIGGSDAEQARWFPVNDLPSLAFDHEKILSYALTTLQDDIEATILGDPQ
jgi:8-oxo-dGTP diphosphatase